MHQYINRNKIYFYFLLFLLLSTISNQTLLSNFEQNFLIKNIVIKLDKPELNSRVSIKLSYLNDKNIFFIDKKNILKNLEKVNYLENIKIKKSYPSTIIVSANKTNLIATTFINQKKYYVGENNQFILVQDININENLPIIFGKFNISEFIKLKEELNKQKINYKSITKYYFHKNKRWDLYYPNNILIMLPSKNVANAINLYKNFKKENHIKPNSIIDLRIADRLVLKNE